MRIPILCAALLVGGCGDDEGIPLDGSTPDRPGDDAPQRPDAGLNRDACATSYVPSFIADSVQVSPRDVGFDLNGDGNVDNSLAQLRMLLNPTLLDTTRRSPYLIISVERLDDPRNDPDVGTVIYQGIDADGDPGNDFSGMGQFWFTVDSVDENCRPFAILPSGTLVDGYYSASAERAVIPLNLASFDVRRAHVTGTILSDLSGISNVVVGGAATPCKLSQTPQTITNQSVLDLLVGGFSMQPDIDLDGDGLEQFVASPGAGVYACIDGNGTRIDGKTCPCDPRIADGYSLALQVTGVKATLLGPVPPPDGGGF